MTDLEITKACAVAIGLSVRLESLMTNPPKAKGYVIWENDSFNGIYNPLHDDAQAMALVKKLRMEIMPDDTIYFRARIGGVCVQHENLNRAICECLARLK